MVMNMLYFLFVLAILVLVHELGHFIAAKMVGIKVDKFSLGLGPKIFGFKKGETEYVISALPMGGFVKMAGENLEDEKAETEGSVEEKKDYDWSQLVPLKKDASDEKSVKEEEGRRFYNKSVGERILVIVSGPMMNILLAIVIYTCIFIVGVPVLTTKVGEVIKDSVAEKSGILVGDRIIAIDGKEVGLWEEMTQVIHSNPDKSIKLTVLRGSENINLDVIPKKETVRNIFNEDLDVGRIGISIGDNPEYITKNLNPFSAFVMAVKETYTISETMLKGLVLMITNKMKADVTGPIGIYQMTKQQVQHGLRSFWTFIAILSINLGIINILPFPVLDGGHLIFLLIEKIKGSPVKVKYREMAQQIGAIILILLFVLIFYKDITRFGSLPSKGIKIK